MQGLQAEITLGSQLAQWLARARYFTRLQGFVQASLVAQLADCHHGMQHVAFRNLQLLTRQLLVQAV